MRRVHLIALSLVFTQLLALGADPLAAKPVSVDLVPENSIVSFTGSTLKNFIKFTGKGSGVSGKFKISSPKEIEGGASFPLDNLKLDMDGRSKHMKEDLEVAKHPEARFVPTRLPWEDPSRVLQEDISELPFEGGMSLHGVEKTVQGVVSTKKDGQNVEYTFSFKILLSDFGIPQRTHLGLKVANEFDVLVKTVAKVVPL